MQGCGKGWKQEQEQAPQRSQCPLQCPKACPLPEEGQQEGKAPFSGLAGGRQEGPSLVRQNNNHCNTL